MENTRNKGFSLVELLVAMAILVLVGGAIIGLISYGFHQYKNISQETFLQTEAQALEQRLRQQILATTKGVLVDETEKALHLFDYDSQTGEKKKTSYWLQQDKKQIIYREYVLGQDGVWMPQKDEECFAEYVKDWEISLKDNTITISYQMQAEQKEYASTMKLNFRNKIKNTGDVVQLYQ